jgi:hypothetical protein
MKITGDGSERIFECSCNEEQREHIEGAVRKAGAEPEK